MTGPLFYKDETSKITSLKGSPLKEHLHVYTKNSTSLNEPYMVPFHKDNGLYLFITPYPGHGLTIRTSSGQVLKTNDVKSDSVIVLMGRGLTDWLLLDRPQRHQFNAAPHAVETMPNLGSRSIFARMKVAPMEAMPLNKTNMFKEVFFNEDILNERVIGKFD